MKSHYQILIVGGGNAGISVASKLLIKNSKLDIAIFDPSEKHYYQPAWTLVGGGVFKNSKTERSEASVMPKAVDWVKQAIASFNPEENIVKTKSGESFTYDYLIVCPGIQLNWHLVEGLKETIGKNGVTSNYQFEYAPYTWELLKNLKKGKAIFTNPNTPIKCGGAPQKIMYMAGDYLKRTGVLKDISVEFYSGGGVIFGIKKYADTLKKVIKRYNIKEHYKHNLVKIDGPNKKATFEHVDADGNKGLSTVDFDMIHVTPPQGAPDFIKESALANEGGWLELNSASLQHVRYANVFGLGDASGTPNAKTGAAIRKQAPVVVENLLALINGKPLEAVYNGYASCPIVTGRGKLMLAEFNYKNEPMETFPFDQAKERLSMYWLKKYVLPWLYWNKILKGTA